MIKMKFLFYLSLNFFFLSAGAKDFFCFNIFSITSGIGTSDNDVI